MTWDLAFILPNAYLTAPIETDFVALVPGTDSRLISLSAHASVVALMHNFSDQFNRRVSPSALLFRKDSPSTLTAEALVAFRNIVAISHIAYGWTQYFATHNGRFPVWSDYFDIYPIHPTNDYQDLMIDSPVSWGLDHAKDFNGQTSPFIGNPRSIMFHHDERLLRDLLKVWNRKYIQGRGERKSRVLFRSLETAYHACTTPTENKSTFYDFGVKLSLWVSAFEILTHPYRGNANFWTVYNLLDQKVWDDPVLQRKRWRKRRGHDSVGIRLVQKLYLELYEARCDFLHGNTVDRERLFAFEDQHKPQLLRLAPLIYRTALVAYIDGLRGFPTARDLRAIMSEAMLVDLPLERALCRAL